MDDDFTVDEADVPEPEWEGDFLVDVRTGELLPATPEKAAEMLVLARNTQDLVRRAIKACEAVLAAESQRQGTRTLKVDGATFEVYESGKVEWDMTVLPELLTAGLPQERYEEAVEHVVTFKPKARELARIAGVNEQYADIIGRARRDVPGETRVRVKRG